MKIIASSFSLSTILAADFAQISYRLPEVANELSPLFLNVDSTSFPTEIFNHGCWCAKLNALPSAGLGGHPVDELDQLCKDWAKARRCSRVNGGTCESASSLILSSSYELEYDYAQGAGTQLCPDSDSCLSETCQIDSHYINLIKDWRTANPGSFVADANPTCENHGLNAALVCDQFPTTARPVDAQAVNDALTDAGVDNTGKAVAVTLVWAGANRCDFDLVVIDPSGEKTYYGNSPSSSGGSLDVDQFGRNAINVENISWQTAPTGTYEVQCWAYGACSQPDFSVYVNIGGTTSTVEGTSNGSRQTVTTFDYISSNRNMFVGTYQGPSQEYGPKQY